MDDIAPRIIALIAKSKAIPPESITRASTFDELLIDSLDKINLTFDVEEMFSIQIPDAALNDLRTVGDVIDGVHRLIDEKAGKDQPIAAEASTTTH
jgi:acyl carrier protein